MYLSTSIGLFLLASASLAKDHNGDADTSHISFAEPVSGAAFHTGDTLNAQWTSKKPIISPSFKLCQTSDSENTRRAYMMNRRIFVRVSRDDDICGDPIWPAVEQTDSGSYQVAMEVPVISEAGSYYLNVEDNFGSVVQSPVFSVSPSQVSVNATNMPTSDSPTPIATPDAPSSPTASIDAAGATSSVEPLRGNTPSVQAPFSQQNVTAPVSDSSSSGNSTTKVVPSASKAPIFVDSNNLLSSGRPTPVAAYAIPLSAAAVALLVAGGLAIRHRGSLRKEREKDRQLLEKLHRSSTYSSSQYGGTGEAKPTLTASLLPHPIQLQPIPLFMPVSVPSIPQTTPIGFPVTSEPRQITRNAFAYQSPIDHPVLSKSSIRSASSYADRSMPVTPSRSVRIRNLCSASTHFSSSPNINEPGIIGTQGNPSSSAPHLPPLSFCGSLSRESYTHDMSKEPSVASNDCATSEILEDYCLSPRSDFGPGAQSGPLRYSTEIAHPERSTFWCCFSVIR
ncbi:hypothetical protein APHAL10511_008205 [Amanita phalloides]|nr:hypothetical protein APHAL10511_008205 [Amanita phalloides]